MLGRVFSSLYPDGLVPRFKIFPFSGHGFSKQKCNQRDIILPFILQFKIHKALPGTLLTRHHHHVMEAGLHFTDDKTETPGEASQAAWSRIALVGAPGQTAGSFGSWANTV